MAKKNNAETIEHSPKFETVKEYYDTGRWKKPAVRKAVAFNWITAAEYEEITGEAYEQA